ncbi:MAG: tRNA lysidine(34) synthetase TilS [Bacteroidetes bacterium]|nr:tRNA lysidine(34) synthetase TilS [Bacteroidota bacterium]
MSLLLKVKTLTADHQIDLSRRRVLLALSGGMDSVVLAAAFHQLGVRFGIAHCNFQLRGDESDGDEALAKHLATKYDVPFFTVRFDTTAYIAERKVSVQVAARDLRYQWLHEVREAHGFHYLATAHHLNDNIETVLHNFIKGTGIKGLRGMLPKNGRLIRPLLEVSREEITAFCRENNLTYREDSSNASTKYTRNKIRHHILPLITEINPGFEKGFGERLKIFSDLEDIYEQRFRKVAKQLFLKRGSDIYIPILKLKQLKERRSLLFDFLQPYGFNATQVDDMLGALDSDSGRQFLSDQTRVVKDRRFLIVTALARSTTGPFYIDSAHDMVKLDGFSLQCTVSEVAAVTIEKDKAHAYLDLDKLLFPLLLRPWRQGDYFYPYGMKLKKKKVSKYFKDQKIAIHQKEAIWILESDQRIVWIVGERIDERFKVSDKTQNVLHIHPIKDA